MPTRINLHLICGESRSLWCILTASLSHPDCLIGIQYIVWHCSQLSVSVIPLVWLCTIKNLQYAQ
jgi:hypothetical protein